MAKATSYVERVDESGLEGADKTQYIYLNPLS